MQKTQVARWLSYVPVALSWYIFTAYVWITISFFHAMVMEAEAANHPLVDPDLLFGPFLERSFPIWRFVLFITLIPIGAFLSRQEFKKANYNYSIGFSVATILAMIVMFVFFK